MARRLCTMALATFALAACGGDDEAPEAVLTDTTAVAAPSAPMEQGAAMEEQVTLSAVGNSGASGQATVSPGTGAEAQVMVTLNGLSGGTTHPGHIHSGSCESLGPVVAPLQEITSDESGTGTMTTTVPVAGNTVMDGQHLIAYHQAGGGPPIVCGQIPAHQM